MPAMAYTPHEIESRWRAYWLEHATFRAEIDPSRPKFYVLDMFPYPSGEGLHVGHPKGYVATDVFSRYKRMQGFNVLHPMGWDAFGLPAEQHAMRTGQHPAQTTAAKTRNTPGPIRSSTPSRRAPSASCSPRPSGRWFRHRRARSWS